MDLAGRTRSIPPVCDRQMPAEGTELVDEEFSDRLAPGVYRLREMPAVGSAASFRR